MYEAFMYIMTSGEIWTIVIKVLISAILGGLATLIATLIAKVICKFKESRIYKYANTLVEAAE